MSYTKLDSKIITSSIWDQPAYVLKCFITFWALCDNEDGVVKATKESVFRSSNLTREEFDTALDALLSPDEMSKSPDNEGKRLLQISNTEWLIVNYSKYRLPESDKKEKHREKMRLWREKNKENEKSDITVTSRDVTGCHSPVSVSVSVSSEGDCKGKQPHEVTFEKFWDAYPKKKSKGAAIKAWQKIKTPVATLEKILVALEKQKKSSDWVKESGQFIPYPASYLNAMGWEDEVQPQLNLNVPKRIIQ